MRGVTVCAANIIAPVLATPEVVVFLFASMAGKTSLRDCLGRFILERNDLCRIAFRSMVLAWTMASLATRDFAFPTADRGKLGMRSVGEGFELIFVTIFAGIATDVIGVSRRYA